MEYQLAQNNLPVISMEESKVFIRWSGNPAQEEVEVRRVISLQQDGEDLQEKSISSVDLSLNKWNDGPWTVSEAARSHLSI